MLIGCKIQHPPDPNDPANASLVEPEAIQNALRGVYESLDDRVRTKELTQYQLRDELRARAREFAKYLDLGSADPADAWRLGDIYRTAELWDKASEAFRAAVKVAATPDRRVNDTLRLAQCEAKLGRPKEAVELARSVFDTPPGDKGAILPASLLEIAPAAMGKGADVPLADLLVDAVEQHLQTVVDTSTDPGKAFMQARPFHIRNAYDLASRLYARAGLAEKAKWAQRKRRDTLSAIRGT